MQVCVTRGYHVIRLFPHVLIRRLRSMLMQVDDTRYRTSSTDMRGILKLRSVTPSTSITSKPNAKLVACRVIRRTDRELKKEFSSSTPEPTPETSSTRRSNLQKRGLSRQKKRQSLCRLPSSPLQLSPVSNNKNSVRTPWFECRRDNLIGSRLFSPSHSVRNTRPPTARPRAQRG